MKMLIAIGCVLLIAPTIYADSAITRYAVGPGFNVYRSNMEFTIPGGKWTSRIPRDILIVDFPQAAAFDAQVKAFDAKIGGKWSALNNELKAAAQRDPLYSQTVSKIAEIDKKVSEEMAKQVRNPADLRKLYEQKQREYVDAYIRAASAQQIFRTFKDAWTAYDKACLGSFKAQRKSGEKDRPVLDALKARGMQLGLPDTVFLIGERLSLNVGPFDPEQIPAEVVKVIGAQNLPIPAKFTKYLLNPTTDAKCDPLRQAAAKAYAQLDQEIQKNADVSAKNVILQKALADLNAVQNQTTVNDKLLRKVLEREFGLDFQLMAMNQIVSRAAAGLRQKVQELQKGIPADLLNAQRAYDPVVDKAIDMLDADIQKVMQQRRQAKIAK